MSSFHDEYANISIGFGFAVRTKHKQKAETSKNVYIGAGGKRGVVTVGIAIIFSRVLTTKLEQ